MGYQSQSVEKELTQLFHGFIDAGLHGRFDEALSLVSDQYSGVGMGEQGIVHNKDEAAHILRDAYIPMADAVIEYEVKDFTINMLSHDIAVILGEVIVTNTPPDVQPMYSGLMQTVGARYEDGAWRIVFTHASPTMLTAKSVEAYPIRFMDSTISALRADLQSGVALQRDPLTSILNREGFERRADELIRDYNPKHNTALFMIDLDNFKQINDRLGHQMGDTVLKKAASALENAFRDVDAVGRVGGDEFMVLMTGDFSAKFLEKKANELLSSIQLNLGDGQEISISISIGIAYGRARSTFDKLYQIADIALYDSKNAGKCSYHMINFDTNAQHSCSDTGSSFLSLQRLLDNTDGKVMIRKTPYEALVENIPGGVVMFELTDKSINVTHCNEWFSRFIGYSEEQMAEKQSKDPFVFVHPEDLPLLLQAEKSIRDGADNSNIIYRVRHRDGSYSHMNQIVTVTERRSGSITMYGIESDVEEVIKLKQDVEAAHKELAALIANVPGSVVLFEFTETGIKSKHLNSWFSRLLGYTEQEMIELQDGNPLVMCHPDDLESVQAATQMIRDGADNNSIVYRVRHRDGSYSHMAQTVSVISRKPDSIVMYGIETDVEETYRLKQEVEDSKSELEYFLQAIPGGVLSICLTADNVLLTHRNHWIHKFLGYSQQEIEDLERGDAFALVHPKDMPFIEKEVEKMRKGVDNVNVVYRLLKKDGKYINVRINASLIKYSPAEAIYYAVITDVEQMAFIQNELEHVNRKFAALLSSIPCGIAIFELGDTLKVEQYGSWVFNFSGYALDEKLEQARQGDKFAKIFPDDVPKIKEALRKMREDGEDRLSLSLRIKCKDGTIKPLHINFSVIERTADNVTMYVIYTEVCAS